MNIIQGMRILVRVVDAGSFVAAAEQMNLSTPHISRMIADLEAHLRARLMNRTTRRMVLTPTGERFYVRSQQVLSLIEEIEAEAAEAHLHPSGSLRMHSIVSFGQQHLIPLIATYQKLYPQVLIDLTLSQRLPDLLEEGYDIALTVASQLPDSGMMVQKLAMSRSVLCASPEYVAEYGKPKEPEDLLNHTCVQLVSMMYPREWYFEDERGEQRIEVKSPFKVNVPEALTIAVQEGMGIGLFPAYAAVEGLRSGKLVRLLPAYRLPEHGIFALYPSRQFLDAKIKTWLEFLKKELPQAIKKSEAVLEDG